MELGRVEFDLLRNFVYNLCGLAIDDQKQYLIKQRLEPIALQQNCTSFAQFYQYLNSSGSDQLYEEVIDAITTHETSFLRDYHPFQSFKESILPAMGAALQSRMTVTGFLYGIKARIWCAASSTGQEPYSIAMLIHEFLRENSGLGLTPDSFSILGTDISRQILDKARAGEYSELEVKRGLTEERLGRFFENSGPNIWRVKESIRKMVEYRQLDLTKPYGNLGCFDIIFCRNVLIYFDEKTRMEIFKKFYSLLNDDGYLILGSTENIYGMTEKFVSEYHQNTLLYRKKI